MYSSYSVTAAVCSCVFPALAALAVAIRFRAKVLGGGKIASDDWLILFSLTLAIIFCSMVLYSSFRAGVGQLLSTFTPEDFTHSQKQMFAGIIMGHLCYGFVKLALLQFYKRVFVTCTFRLWSNIMFTFVSLFMLSATITQIFSAWPISNYWTIGKSFQINYGAFITAFAAIDLVLDVVILLMPLPVVRKLHVSTGRKYLIIGVFWIGFFCVVATAVRLYFGYQISFAGHNRPLSDDYFSYLSVQSTIWGEVEACCSIIAACLPTYGPIVRSMTFPSWIMAPIDSIVDSYKHRGKKSSKISGSDSWFGASEQHKKLAVSKETQSKETLIYHNVPSYFLNQPPSFTPASNARKHVPLMESRIGV